jgi:hypothetical protein
MLSAKDKAAPDPFEEQAAAMSGEELDELRERVLRKVERLAARREAEGWTYDEEYRLMVPPGWKRASDQEGSEEAPRE